MDKLLQLWSSSSLISSVWSASREDFMAPSAAADASYLWFVLSLRLECRPGLSWEERPSGLDQDESWNKQWSQRSGSDYDWETCSTEVNMAWGDVLLHFYGFEMILCNLGASGRLLRCNPPALPRSHVSTEQRFAESDQTLFPPPAAASSSEGVNGRTQLRSLSAPGCSLRAPTAWADSSSAAEKHSRSQTGKPRKQADPSCPPAPTACLRKNKITRVCCHTHRGRIQGSDCELNVVQGLVRCEGVGAGLQHSRTDNHSRRLRCWGPHTAAPDSQGGTQKGVCEWVSEFLFCFPSSMFPCPPEGAVIYLEMRKTPKESTTAAAFQHHSCGLRAVTGTSRV